MLSGDEIRQARQRAGLSQAELAAIVGVSMRSIGNYERGETIPRNRMPRIEEALSAHLGTSEGPSLASASDAALLAEIARRFERGKSDGNAAAITPAGEDPAKKRQKARRAKYLRGTPATDPASDGRSPGGTSQGRR